VNRARQGATVVVFNGKGTEWICDLTGDSKRAAELSVRCTQHAPHLPHHIALAQALPKGNTFEAIVRKATEIGVAEIYPVQSERTQVHLEGSRSERKHGKWHTAALEAAKQCGNPWLPTFHELQPITPFLAMSRDYDLKLIASLHPGAKSLKTVLAERTTELGHAPRRVLWAIGPEGDFTPSEMSLAHDAGFEPITLGPLVLRCETAAVYALSVLSYELSSQ
jgi:16S rRNA (uracil1498-N3)-methyltransferase